ncbi:MAG: hypothetical protein R3D84_17205 [Paracoccaceae bacterium]
MNPSPRSMRACARRCVELKRLQRENNQTFVYVSHDEEEVMAISDRVAVIVGGRIAQIGTPDEVYNEPCSLAVAGVIGSPPMNFSRAASSADGLRFECDALETSIPVAGTTQKGGAATLGIRPEDIWLGESEGKPSFMRVSTVEPLGGYTIINARVGQQIVKIRAPGQVVLAEDSWQTASPDARRLHLFGSEGVRL